MESEEI